MKTFYKSSAALIAAVSLMSAGAAFAAIPYSFFGDGALDIPGFASPTAALIRSENGGAGYGGVSFGVPANLTFANLTVLQTDYVATTGGCGGGSPRFQVDLKNPSTNVVETLFVYLGGYPNYNSCAVGLWQNSGNLLSSGNYVDAFKLGGGPYTPYDTAVALYGGYTVVGIQAVVDSSWLFGSENAKLDNVVINSNVETFEPVLTGENCKNGGWALFASAPGPFKNQGQCVSYFAKAK